MKSGRRCGGCGAQVKPELRQMIGRLLEAMSEAQARMLRETYAGTPPKILCARCFNAAVSHVNALAAH